MSDIRSRRKKRRQQQQQLAPSPPTFDRRAMEKTFADIGRLLEEQAFESPEEATAFLNNLYASGEPIPAPARPLTPLEQAQDLMYEAWGAVGLRRVELARGALSISADCADAYVLLAEELAATPEEALSLYEQGVKAGERALGEAFEEYVGSFWSVLETRPYMRARAGLAECLLLTGKRQQAIGHYQEMLRLNPGDNQGLRHLLITLLLEDGEDKAAKALLDQYADDASATWAYSRALWLFRQKGASRAAKTKLKAALSYNPFVPPYLLGQKKLPRHLPPYVGFGDENEAVSYAAEAMAVWQKNRAALAWLRETVADLET